MNIKQIIIIIAGFILVICTFIFPYWHQPGVPSAWAAFYPVTSPPWGGKGVVNLGYTLLQAIVISALTITKAITFKHDWRRRNLNSGQGWRIKLNRFIILAGSLFILLSLLVPPWKCFHRLNSYVYSTKYAFLWNYKEYCHIDTSVLLTQILAICIIFGALFIAFKIKSNNQNV